MDGTRDIFLSLCITVVSKAVVQYDGVVVGALFFRTHILFVCLVTFISGLQSLQEVHCSR